MIEHFSVNMKTKHKVWHKKYDNKQGNQNTKKC